MENSEQMKKVFFKIIIPNYNNYIYIKKCLDSVLNQTFKDYMCIVVDDLSTDNSPKIAQIYQKRHPDRFKFIKLDKKGYAGAARNKGLDYPIDSEYILFLDSDDYLYQSNSLECLHKNILANNFPDIVRCSFSFSGQIRKECKNPNIFVFNGAAPWKNAVNSKYSNIKFKEDRSKHNDVVWFLRLLDSIDIQKISVMNEVPLVFYNARSITSCWFGMNKDSQKNIDSIKELITDLQLESFKSSICNSYKKYEILISFKRLCKNKIKRIVAMSSFPDRKEGMLNVVERLSKQCDFLLIWLNDYEEIPPELSKYNNVIPMIAGEYSYVRENGRLYWTKIFKNDYYIMVDDDILYPEDYVKNICLGIDRNGRNCIVSYHGAIFENGKEKRFPFHNEMNEDTPVHRIGGGVSGFIPSKIGFTCPEIEELKEFDGDASISVWATMNKIKKICLKRPKGYLKELIIDNKNMARINGLQFNPKTPKLRDKIYKQLDKWESL